MEAPEAPEVADAPEGPIPAQTPTPTPTPGAGGPARPSAGVPGASDAITAEVTTWPGIHTATGERGEWSFRLGPREIGHLHGDRVMHAAFPKPVFRALHEAGRVGHHPVFPGSDGWAAREIGGEDDVRDVVALLRLNYDRITERHPASAG